MQALDALASEAAQVEAGPHDVQRPQESLEAMESAGGPPMPPAGQQAAATKLHGTHDEGSTSAGHALAAGPDTGGVGDAAMAAVDDRLDTNELPHTNGDLTNGHNHSSEHPHEEVDYARVANVSSTQPPAEQDQQQERVPAMSVDVEQPARNLDEPEKQGEAIEPAPGPDHSAPSLAAVDTEPTAPAPAAQAPEDTQNTSTEHSQAAAPQSESATAPAEPSTSALPSEQTEQQPTSEPQLPAAATSSSIASLLSGPEGAQPSPAPMSMDALPDDPAPLPSQLVNGTVPQNDLTQAGPSESIPADQQTLSSTEAQPEPTIPADAQPIPPTHPEQTAPAELSPSVAKRPFEPDNSEASIAYQGDDVEPQSKRVKVSPEAEDAVANDAAMSTAGVDPTFMKAEHSRDAPGEQDTSMGEFDQSYALSAGEHSFQNGTNGMHVDDQEQKQDADGSAAQSPSEVNGQAPETAASTESKLPAGPMPKEQVKYAQAILRTLKKKTEAGPFLQPVDPVALGIPHYPQVVTQPMDLSTVERKLSQNQYMHADEFIADMNLIWQNCYTFNGPDNAISAWAKTLSGIFDKQVAKMPTLDWIEAQRAVSPASGKISYAKSSKPRRSSNVGGPRLSGGRGAYEADYEDFNPRSSKSSGSMKHQPKKSGSFSAGMGSGGYGAIHQLQQQQMQVMQQLQQHQMGGGDINSQQLKFCKEVIKELFKKQHQNYAYPFYEPVDYMALGIPDYPKIIRRPMDLGTMKRKLDSGQYPSAAAFENDFKLLINNCYTYNPPMTPVHTMGEQLNHVFYEKWRELPQDDMSGGWSGYGAGYGDGMGGGNSYESEQIMLMQRQLELLTGNLEMLKNKQRMGMPPPGRRESQYGPPSGMQMAMGMPHMGMPPPPPPVQKAPKPPPAPKAPRPPPKRRSDPSYSPQASTSSVAPAPPKPRTTKRSSQARGDDSWVPPPRGSKDSDYEDDEVAVEANVTFEMKRELAEKIGEFDGNKLEIVVGIIRDSAPDLLPGDNNEIELDIDMLDQRTLLKLYEYAVRPIGKGRQLKPKKNKPKGRNRGVDEVAEEHRINALQAQLDAMQNGSLPAMPAAEGVAIPDMPTPTQQQQRGDVASSSSEEEDEDPSDSESDAFAPDE